MGRGSSKAAKSSGNSILNGLVSELASDMKNVPFTSGVKTRRDQMLEREKKRNPNVVGMVDASSMLRKRKR